MIHTVEIQVVAFNEILASCTNCKMFTQHYPNEGTEAQNRKLVRKIIRWHAEDEIECEYYGDRRYI